MNITPVNYANQKVNNQPAFGANFKNQSDLALQLVGILKEGEAYNFNYAVREASGKIERIKTYNNQDLDVVGRIIKNAGDIKQSLLLKIQGTNNPNLKREYTLDFDPSISGQKLARQIIKTIKTAAKNNLQSSRVLEGRELPHNIFNVEMPKVTPPKSE